MNEREGGDPARGPRPVELTGDQWRAGAAGPPFDLRPADPGAIGPVADHLASTGVVLPAATLAAVVADHRPLAGLVAGRFSAPGHQHPTLVVGIAGAVAAGKSLTAQVLAALLTAGDGPRTDVVSTDGFLYPNQELAKRGLTERKGFPESYDQARLVAFLSAVRSGHVAEAPLYDHDRYDVVAGRVQLVDRPEVLIVEGVNVLQAAPPGPAVSDFVDLSVYIDADETDLHRWFLIRMRALRAASTGDPSSFFAGFAGFSDNEFSAIGDAVWTSINRPNLVDHIAPTRTRADLVLEKAPDHTVRRVVLTRR